MKQCGKCGIVKQDSDFHARRNRRDGNGLYHWCKECWGKYNREYYHAHKYEETKERHRRWFSENPGKAKEYRSKQYLENKERELELAKEWRKANPEKVAGYSRQYARMKRANGGDFTDQEWQNLLTEYSGMCAACGSTDTIEADHIVPLSKGGKNTRENIQPLCRSCNRHKAKRTISFLWNIVHGD